MIKKSLLILATTFAAGLLFVNVYNSLVDAVSWGNNIPTSIQTAREYFKVVNPGSFFRVFSPVNQVLTLLALIACWKTNKRIRIYCALALLSAVAVDAFTFAYFFPRNEIMFSSPINTNVDINNVDAIRAAWNQWTSMNWFRSGVEVINIVFDFAALIFLSKEKK